MNKTRKNKKCSIELITVSTKKHPDLERYKKSAEKYGFKPHILGLHENRTTGHSKRRFGGFGGSEFGFKLQYLLEFCRKRKYSDIILFTDAWDVVIVDDCSELIKKYKSFKKDIVIGAEKMLHPALWFYLFYFNNVPFPYLNAGLIIGKAGIIKELLEKYWKKEDSKIDDQVLWTKIYLENKNKICLDEKAEIFLNLMHLKNEDFIYKNNKLYLKETKTFPSIVHCQGDDKSLLDHIRY